MTLYRLHQILGELLAQGHGRALVAVDKESFQDNRESDGCIILPVSGAAVYYVPQADGDGGHAENKDGTEKLRKTCVIYGCSGLSDKAEPKP